LDLNRFKKISNQNSDSQNEHTNELPSFRKGITKLSWTHFGQGVNSLIASLIFYNIYLTVSYNFCKQTRSKKWI